jgi:hypothetical protein
MLPMSKTCTQSESATETAISRPTSTCGRVFVTVLKNEQSLSALASDKLALWNGEWPLATPHRETLSTSS